MKINVLPIVFSHFQTLKDEGRGKMSSADFWAFILFPIAVSASSPWLNIKTSKEIYSTSIAVFAIFLPLLLNIQVAVFTVYIRQWKPNNDDIKLKEIYEERRILRNSLMKEININLSYLVVLCSFIVSILTIVYISDINNYITVLFISFAYTHFIMTLLMVIKRAHALFHKEYSQE